jgi:hypothetical protein
VGKACAAWLGRIARCRPAKGIGHGHTITVVEQAEIEHKVRIRDFEAWIESNDRWW